MEQNTILCVIYTKIPHQKGFVGSEMVRRGHNYKVEDARPGFLRICRNENADNFANSICVRLEEAKNIEYVGFIEKTLTSSWRKRYTQMPLYQRQQQLYEFHIDGTSDIPFVELHPTSKKLTINLGNTSIVPNDCSVAMSLQLELEQIPFETITYTRWKFYNMMARKCSFLYNEPINHELWDLWKIPHPSVIQPYQGWNEWFDALHLEPTLQGQYLVRPEMIQGEPLHFDQTPRKVSLREESLYADSLRGDPLQGVHLRNELFQVQNEPFNDFELVEQT